MSNQITISYGDTKDGSSALEAALKVIADAGAMLEIETVQLGAEMEKLGFEKGFDDEAVNKIRRAGALLKAPTKKNISADLHAALGDEVMIFEAASATSAAMLEAAVMMLCHLGQDDVAERINNYNIIAY
jgi:isocitrate/isopropylmalate dehydrogenase